MAFIFQRVNIRVPVSSVETKHYFFPGINPPMTRGVDATPRQDFFNFSREWEELFLKTKFLAVASTLGHLCLKKFSDRIYRLGSKIGQRECTLGEGVATTPMDFSLPIFLTMKMTLNLSKS